MKKTMIAMLLGSFLFTGNAMAEEVASNQNAQVQHQDVKGDVTITDITPNMKVLLQIIAKNITAFGTGPRDAKAMPLMVFFDPQCPYCKNLWSAASAPENKDIPIIWIPVGIVNELSMDQSAAILQSEDAEKTMNQHEADIATGGKGLIVDKQKLDKQALINAQKNTLLFGKMNLDSVPIILHVTKDGKLLIKKGDVDIQGVKALYER